MAVALAVAVTEVTEEPRADAADRLTEAQARLSRCAELEATLRALAAQITALQGQFLDALAEYDRLEGWADWGARSATEWLSNHCGHSTQLGNTELKVAHAFEHLPGIRAAMAEGALSLDKARAIAAVASPETESELLALAREVTANQLVRALAAARQALCTKEAQRLRRARHLHTWWDDDGMLAVRGRLTPEEGALFRKALEAAQETLHREQRSAGFEDAPPAEGEPDVRPDPAADADDPAGARRADALLALAESYLEHGPADAGNTDHYQVIVHVDADVLVDTGDGRCQLEAGPALSGETLRRLACGASLVWLATDERGDPVAISEKTQSIPTALRRAVRARDQGCVYPNGVGGRCGLSPQYCDVHHVTPRANGGAHTTRNCRMLCRFHHHLVHEGGFQMTVLDDGSLDVRRPDGTRVLNHPPPTDLITGAAFLRQLELETDVSWANSNGQPMDLVATVDALVSMGLTGRPGP